MEERKYTKLKDLVGSEFTIEKIWGYKFKMWDNENKKMLQSDTWVKGYRKLYDVDTDKGKMDLSESQLGSIFVNVQHAGKSDVIGVTVAVKSNGKEGIDIRYFLNPVKKARREEQGQVQDVKQDDVYDVSDEPVDLGSIPFN